MKPTETVQKGEGGGTQKRVVILIKVPCGLNICKFHHEIPLYN
jgi:hypothetical protein